MAGIGKNRVFDHAAIEDLKTQVMELMKAAAEVTQQLSEEMQKLRSLAEEVPAEARHGGLSSSAGALLGTLDTGVYEDMSAKITDKLAELNEQVPAYDSRCAGILGELSSTAGSLAGMLEELKGLIGQGSLHMSLEEFSAKLEEYETKWTAGGAALSAKMMLAMTALKGLVLVSEFSRDPVNLSTGNLYYEKEDLKVRGMLSLSFKRHYNAMETGSSALGEGWSHTDGEHIGVSDGKAVSYHEADGRERVLKEDGEKYIDIYSGEDVLEKEGDGYRHKDRKGHTLHFGRSGEMRIREDGKGNRILYGHDTEGRIISAENHGQDGRKLGGLYYAYKEDGKLKEVSDHTGRRVSFFYMDGRLSEVTDPEGNVTGYRYGENGKLRAVKNAMGVLTVRNEYDEQGRVIRQRFPDKSEMHYEYDDDKNTTTLTERNGSRITYVQDEKLRNVKILYHDSEESCTYNERNLRTSRTDRRGNTTHYRYDDKGHLTGIINALHEKISLTYNGDGKVTSVKSGGKEVLKNSYDSRGRLVSSSDALGRVRENIYDERGLVCGIRNADGSVTGLEYDERGNITGMTDPNGVHISYRYDELNRIIETEDGSGNRTGYAYDRKDRLVKVTNAEGNSRSYSYNGSGRVTRVEDFDGGITEITYNGLNRPESLKDKEGRVTRRNYDRMWNVSEEISPTGARTGYRYDADNRLSGVEVYGTSGTEPVQRILYGHDEEGNLTRIESGGAGEVLRTTSYTYDALNRVSSMTDENGGTVRYTYHENGKVETVTDQTGGTRRFTYNDAGELIRETDAEGRTTTYEYNALGQVSCITDPAGRKSTYTYGKGGRLEREGHPDGRSMSYSYDESGRIRTKTDGTGYSLTYRYDCMGRIREILGKNGERKSYEYDVMGNVTAMTDANGSRTVYEYSLCGNLTAVTDALGNRTEYRYDALDNLTAVIRKGDGEEEQTTEYLRDVFGQVETMRDAMGKEEHFRYDALGRMVQKTDRDGYVTSYSHAPDGRVEKVLYGDGRGVALTYDALRRLIMVEDWLGTTRIERDHAGRPLSVTDHQGRTVSYGWGIHGERERITYPDGREVTYLYDEKLRLSAMELPEEGGRISYRYDELGRPVEKRMPDGLRTQWQYDADGRLGGLTHEDKEGILDSWRYGYDRMGNRTAITRRRRGLEGESGNYGYGYDALGRLALVTREGEVLRSYAYDAFGNRVGMEEHTGGRRTAYRYDRCNRLTGRVRTADGMEQTRLYRYDNRGNLTGEEEDGRTIHGYRYGALGRLESAWDGDGTEASYLYNGLGQRMGKETAGVREDYLIDMTRAYHNLLECREGDRCRTFYWDRNVAAMEEEGLHWYLQDELGSPVRVNGYPEEGGYLTYGYDEFGEDLSRDFEEAGIPNPYEEQGEGQPFGYTGYRYDRTGGTYFAQAREYQPETGRFMAEDVIKGNGAYPETLNSYAYCMGNPMSFVDLNGREPEYNFDLFLSPPDSEPQTVPDLFPYLNIPASPDSEPQTVPDLFPYLNIPASPDSEPQTEVTETGNLINTVIFKNNNGTVTYGLNLSGTLTGIYMVDGSIGISLDYRGNVAIQATGAWGVTAQNFVGPSVSFAGYRTVTNAPNVYELNGEGACIGGSGAAMAGAIPLYVGGDFVIVGDLSNRPADYKNYYGFTEAVGFGMPGFEGHAEISNTVTLVDFNILDLIIDFIYKKVEKACDE
ncbi:MAG: RHS repeat-associated core domain-containing protein [Lachnospiraceae bacterium]|nr:RHS repeat-associated core domain-containing protein [Lachnospiraceae bacterium]